MSTINAASVGRDDIAAAIALAGSGDTVVIPEGTANWTETLAVNKAITVQGQTVVDLNTGVATDLTIITDNVAYSSSGSGQASIIAIGASNARVTGLTFTGGSRDVAENGALAIGAGATHISGVRIDHCHFKPLWQRQYTSAAGWVDDSVIDHNVMEFGSPSWKGAAFISLNANWNGGVQGDGAFADDTNWGTNKFVFFEDNYVINHTQYQTLGGLDSYYGGRYVCRYNDFFNVTPNTHGTEGPYRGNRAVAIYFNRFYCDPSYNLDTAAQVIGNMGQLRGGCALWHDNNWYGANIPSGMILETYRSVLFTETTPAWGSPGAANGGNPHDINATEADGTHVDGHSSHLFESGNVTAFNGTNVLTDNTKAWVVNQWANYGLTNTTTGHVAVILSNTATTLTYYVYSDFPAVFNVAAHYEIRRVLVAADQAGRGKSDMITRDIDGYVTSGYPNNALEPVYSWNNKHLATGTDITVSPSQFNGIAANGVGQLQEGRDYINGTALPGYTPYIYPHPLNDGTISGGGSSGGSPPPVVKKKEKPSKPPHKFRSTRHR